MGAKGVSGLARKIKLSKLSKKVSKLSKQVARLRAAAPDEASSTARLAGSNSSTHATSRTRKAATQAATSKPAGDSKASGS
jgi:hypothetical protein